MTTKLVSDQDISDYLLSDFLDSYDATTTKTIPVGALGVRDAVEDHLESLTGQVFGPEADVEEELVDGTGTRTLYAARPIKTLTSMDFLRNVNGDEWYDAYNGLVWVTVAGSRRIVLRNSNFPWEPLSVRLSYTASANQPRIAIQAVKEATASIVRRMGSEDARSEQQGTFQHVMLRSLKELPTWQNAVEQLTLPILG